MANLQGMSPFGAYDLAGNVREWCFNKAGDRCCILGCSFFELLDTPQGQKRPVLFNRGHPIWVKWDVIIQETIDWLDKYPGPVN